MLGCHISRRWRWQGELEIDVSLWPLHPGTKWRISRMQQGWSYRATTSRFQPFQTLLNELGSLVTLVYPYNLKKLSVSSKKWILCSSSKTISHSFAALTRKILFLQLEHKISISSPLCNILYVFFLGNYIHSYSYSLWFSVLVFPTYAADLLLVKRKLC